MGLPQFENPSGAINGANLVFTTSVPYTAGTTALYLNGQLLMNRGGNPWTETDPAAGVVTINDTFYTPRVGDEVAIFFLDTSDAPLVQEILPLTGNLEGPSRLDGRLVLQALVGTEEVNLLDGVADVLSLVGAVVSSDTLAGIVEEC